MRCTALLAVLLAIALPAPACEVAAVWPAATERDGAGHPVRRFIPPELYMGAPWDGSRELVLRPVDVTRKPLIPSDHPPIQFTGPFPWDRTPEILTIKRTRFGRRSGTVDQLFRINERGDGLGRVADLRPGRARPMMDECFKFPLGLWQQGEVRRCRESKLSILEIDFTFQCVPHALKFDWNGEGIYVFSPDRGLVAILHGVD